MGLFDAIAGGFAAAKASLDNELAKYNTWDFADAVTAICALTSAADGVLEKEERAAFGQMLAKNATLARFDRSKMAKRYDELATKALDDITKEDVFEVIAKVADDRPKAYTALKLAIVVAKADGDFEKAEGAVLVEVCNRFGLDPDKVSPEIKKAASKAA